MKQVQVRERKTRKQYTLKQAPVARWSDSCIDPANYGGTPEYRRHMAHWNNRNAH